MRCPRCKHVKSDVSDTRHQPSKYTQDKVGYGPYLFRSRKCRVCEYRWQTVEITRELYDEFILRRVRMPHGLSET